mmetsp:Transcript_10586/g.14497  ORF Transcript_10586/g.14497 Transcript_10586/m.14497 type:complete len:170 (-) Transcript_10586:248-757(-)
MNLLELPDEILMFHIFRFLRPSDLATFESVCKHAYSLVNTVIVWRIKAENVFGVESRGSFENNATLSLKTAPSSPLNQAKQYKKNFLSRYLHKIIFTLPKEVNPVANAVYRTVYLEPEDEDNLCLCLRRALHGTDLNPELYAAKIMGKYGKVHKIGEEGSGPEEYGVER